MDWLLTKDDLPKLPSEGPRYTGVIKYVDMAKGYGYITAPQTGDEPYMQTRSVYGGVSLKKGDQVTFNVTNEERLRAVNIVKVGDDRSEVAYQRVQEAKAKRNQPAEDRRAYHERIKANRRESSARLREQEMARITERRKALGLE